MAPSTENNRQERKAMGTPRKPIADRFLAKITKLDSGCWQWNGYTDRAGYGRLRSGGEGSPVLYTHRLAYEIYKSRIPEGTELDHLCRNRWCSNPDHLEPVTHQVNMQRGYAAVMRERREQPLSKRFTRRRTACRRGHEYSETNTYHDKTGHRFCRQCRQDRENERKARWYRHHRSRTRITSQSGS